MASNSLIERRRVIAAMALGTALTCVLGSAHIIAVGKSARRRATGQAAAKLSRRRSTSEHSGTIGMNLSPPSYYSNTHPFLNRIRTVGDFSATGSVNQFGYPTAPRQNEATAWSLFSIEPKTAGISNRWIILHNGRGTASLRSQSNVPVTLVSGEGTQRVVFDYNDPHESQCRIDLRMTDWPTKIAIVRADQEVLFASGETFNPPFLENCKQWSVLRFMDWLATNYHSGETGAKSWQERPSPEYITWCRDGGVPIEICAELCVKTGCDMWYNVPFNYEPISWQSSITYLRDALGTRRLHVEYSNEVWNYAFQAAHDALAAGQQTSIGGEPGGTGTYYGRRSAEVMKDAIAIFGSERRRLITHLGVQEVNRQTYLDAERGFRSLGHQVAELVDEVSGTFYIDGGFQGDAPAGTRTPQKEAILNLARSVNSGEVARVKALSVVFAQLQSGGQPGFTQDGVTIESHKRDSLAWAELADDRGWNFGFYEGQLYHWSLTAA